MYLLDLVRKYAHKNPQKLALINHNGSTKTYSQLAKEIDIYSNMLSKSGFKKGERVLLFADKNLSFPAQYLATHAANGISVPLNPGIPIDRINLIKKLCKPHYVFYGEKFEKISDDSNSVHDLSKDIIFPADLLFTTGTTGVPKGVLLTKDNINAAIENINHFVGTSQEDIELIALPLSHSFGLGRMRCVLAVGGTIVLADGFSQPKKLFQLIQVHGVTGLGMVPTAWAVLHKLSGQRIGKFRDSLRYIEFGSAPMERVQKELLANLLPNTRLCMHYGLTEASRAAFQEFHLDKERLDSIGRPGPLVNMTIKNKKGKDVNVGEIGEICITGDMVMSRYWNNPMLTEKSFFGDWFRSGDLGYKDSDGYFYLTGRASDIINVGGLKVAPLEVENAIRAINGIIDVGCVGNTDSITGEIVVAYVVVKNAEISSDYIFKALRNKLEPYKIPGKIKFVKSIPKTNSGKIQRKLLLQIND